MIYRIAVFFGAALLVMTPCALAQNQEDEPAAVPEQSEQREALTQASSRPHIYPTLAAGLIEMGVPVIDVRSDTEIAETGTLAGATQIPHTDIDAIAEFIGGQSRAVVMYCGSGRRVGLVIDALRERGYHGMVNAGGYDSLRQELEGQNDG